MRSKLEFIKSAVEIEDCPVDPVGAWLPEIALTGRSNTGKSSFINALCGQKKMASVSRVPGKTRLINFFQNEKKYRIVDLPGYGFSSRSGDEEESWGPMVQNYLQTRAQVAGVLLMFDARRVWDEREKMLARFLDENDIPFAVVATKVDKLSGKDLKNQLQKIKQMSQAQVLPVSNLQGAGVYEAEDYFYQNWVKSFQQQAKEL
jgi:GTP-binding protein